MHRYFLLFLTLIFVGTCTGRGHVQRTRPRPPLNSAVTTPPFASVSVSNGSSIEEILKELDVRYNIIAYLFTLSVLNLL